MVKKVLFFDIDGTLLNSELKIPEGVKKELKRLKDAGHYLFVASGRPLAFISNQIIEAGFDGFVLCNGAHVELNHKIIFENRIPYEKVVGLMKMLESVDCEYNYETGLYNLLKWQSFDTEVPDVTPNFNLIPVLRLSEMYYIISECRYNTSDATNAQLYLQKVRDAYKADTRTVDMNRYQKELTLEMKKEYLTEGQLFFFYKRLNISIENGGETVNVGNKFILPIPEKEDVF